jgi:AcrR family transcriptional regulator
MPETPDVPQTRKLTARGAATKERITQAAAQLIYVKGVNPTTLDDVRMSSGVRKSQLYNHFPDKNALVHEVITLQSRNVLAREEQRLRRLTSLQGLQRGETRSCRPTASRTVPTAAPSARWPSSCPTRMNGHGERSWRPSPPGSSC